MALFAPAHAQAPELTAVIRIVERTEQERALPEGKPLRPISVQGRVHDQSGKAIPGARVLLTSAAGAVYSAESGAEGLFRLPDNGSPKHTTLFWAANSYSVTVEKDSLPVATLSSLRLAPGELVILDVVLPVPASVESGVGPTGVAGLRTAPLPPVAATSAYPGAHSEPPKTNPTEAPPETVPPDSANFETDADRWRIPMPEWRRYAGQPEVPYVKGHWYDPFNRNRFKGDYPVFGQQWFLNFTGESATSVEARRLNLPSGVSGAGGGNAPFFGRGEQSFS
ncbi:MAG: carboxypeptidase-like regulatory domain-containing protein, partial [Terriglobales bacterium]